MWLFPRLFALSIFCLVLSFVCFLIKRTNLSVRGSLSFYNIILAVMAFFFVPASGNDLYRILIVTHEYSHKTFLEMVKLAINSNSPGSSFYYWIFGRIGIDGLLPAVTSFLVFGLCFSIILMIMEDYSLARYDVALILLIFMSRGLYFHAISGIRNMLSFSIIAWCIYREESNRSNFSTNLPFYFVACSLHLSAIALVLYRLLYLVFMFSHDTKGRTTKIVACVCVVAAFIYGQKYITNAIEYGFGYYQDKVLGQQYSYFWEGLLSAISIVIALCCIRRIRISSISNETKVSSNGVLRFLVPLLVFDIGSIFFSFSVYHRFSTMITILNCSLIAILIQNSEEPNVNKYRNTLYILALFSLFIACARGNLCSLKFFE